MFFNIRVCCLILRLVGYTLHNVKKRPWRLDWVLNIQIRNRIEHALHSGPRPGGTCTRLSKMERWTVMRWHWAATPATMWRGRLRNVCPHLVATHDCGMKVACHESTMQH